MTIHSFHVPGGFADHRPGLAASALALLSAPLSATPGGRAATAGGKLHSGLAARDVAFNVWLPTDAVSFESIWAAMAPVSDSAARALDRLRRSAAQTELTDPVERALHALETAVWGRSRWSVCWGGHDDVYTGQELDEVLTSWQSTKTFSEPREDACVLPDLALFDWADGPMIHHGKISGRPSVSPQEGRVEIAVMIPVTGKDSAGYAVAAAQALGKPFTGLLYEKMRMRRPLAYGIAVVPLIRGGNTALAVICSTAADRALDCADAMNEAIQELLAVPIPRALLRIAVTDAGRQRGLALARLAAAQPVNAQQRCLLEAGQVVIRENPEIHFPKAIHPRWAVYGEVADRDQLERVTKDAW
ncbi:hypothetical protein [Streptomyces sp. NPDC102282]|uniref:hypothetical protein n=1 Tax=Streptomyces sp. NPDC102282 TaxID=3366154 RepID=UPI003811607A